MNKNLQADEFQYSKLLKAWFPLTLQWLLMSLEGPIVASFITKFSGQEFNLAAHGIAFSIGLIVEAPIMMMLSASNALVRGKQNYGNLLKLNIILCAALTLVMLGVQIPSVFNFISYIFNINPLIHERTKIAASCLILWPAAIGIRRFFHGILTFQGKTKYLAYGTGVRLTSVVLIALFFSKVPMLPPAALGTGAIGLSVVTEMMYTFIISKPFVHIIKNTADTNTILTLKEMASYYFPLIVMSFISVSVMPIVAMFIGYLPFPIESLATYPLLSNFSFALSSPAIALQELLITAFTKHPSSEKQFRKLVWWTIGISTVVAYAIALTPLSTFWFKNGAGLSHSLMQFIPIPLLIVAILPAGNAWLAYARAKLLTLRQSKFVGTLAAIELGGILFGFTIGVATHKMHSLSGVLIAALSLLNGKFLAILFYTQKGENHVHAKIYRSSSRRCLGYPKKPN